MPMLHDPAVRRSLASRLEALRPDAPRKWGIMTADQMLWHVNQFLGFAIDGGPWVRPRTPIPLPVFKFILMYMPWPKGAPTNPSALAKEKYDFEAERARCRTLIEKFVSRPVDGPWPVDPTFGPVTGKFATTLQARHLDHHFRQFGA